MKEELEEVSAYLDKNLIQYEEPLTPNVWNIGDKSFMHIYPKDLYNEEGEKVGENVIFDNKMNINLSNDEKIIWRDNKIDYFFFLFGGKYYYTPAGIEDKLKLKPLKYIGEAKQKITPISQNFSHLGIHSCYELLNGTRKYDAWIEKAKFLKYDTLGICEKNTLSGAIDFYFQCKKENIHPVLGETVSILHNEIIFDLKFYAKSLVGWKNLLKINATSKDIEMLSEEELKVFEPHTDFESIEDFLEGLIVVLPYNFPLDSKIVLELQKQVDYIYYQIDTVKWSSEGFDNKYLDKILNYLENHYEEIKPILINDSYYLDEEDHNIKKIVNKIGGVGFQNSSKNQHFKTLDESIETWIELFEDKDIAFEVISEAIKNTSKFKDYKFEIKSKNSHLPKFNYSKWGYSSSEEMIEGLLEKRLLEKPHLDTSEIRNRIKIERDLIVKGEVEDYFLILWDIVRECSSREILTGIGRGSAAGSILAYLLDITRINPLNYDLLFERFLNQARLDGGGLPDIDLDVETKRRGEVLDYVKQEYGEDNFCIIGTLKTFKIKEGIQGLSRLIGVDTRTRNFITSLLEFQENTDKYFEEIFKAAQKVPYFKRFIQENPELVHQLYYLLDTPKALSVHPCATVVLPNYQGEDIYDYIPLRFERDKETKELIVISEWDGPMLEDAGFLKEDLLSLSQLDKFSAILKLVKENKNEEIDIYSLPLNDKKVYKLFHEGYNGDVFQFHSSGLTSLSKELKPDNIEELGAMVALYRPGPISSNAHKDFVSYKFNKKKPTYDFALRDVTIQTFGLYIYQEQVMKACVVLGGFTLAESEGIRKAMGKKIVSKMESYKKQFIKNAKEKKNCPEETALEIWNKLEAFSGYGFNKSHAISYAQTGYISQYLKYYHPLEFWTVGFDEIKGDQKWRLHKYISEIRETVDHIKVIPPEINRSSDHFACNPEESKIYFSLSKIKGVGESYLEELLSIKEKNGKFYSFSEFLTKTEGKLNKRVIINLILSGSFDEIEEIKKPIERSKLIEQFFNFCSFYDEEKVHLRKENWWYILQQKQLTELGGLDYKSLIKKFVPELEQRTPTGHPRKYLKAQDLKKLKVSKNNQTICSFGGVIRDISERSTKKGNVGQIELESDHETIYVNIWGPEWQIWGETLQESKGKVILFGASVTHYNNQNTLNFFHADKKDYKDPIFILEADTLELPSKTRQLSIKKGDQIETQKGTIGKIIKYSSNKEITIQLGDETTLVICKNDIKIKIED